MRGEGAELAADPELMAELRARPWLGNVRELRNVLERILALGAREGLAMSGPLERGSAVETREVAVDFRQPYKEVGEQWLEQLEQQYFGELLARHDRNVRSATDEAGVDRTYLYRLIRKHDL